MKHEVIAVVKAGDRLFIMGPPDLLNEDEMFTSLLTPEVNQELEAQDASICGERGSILMAVSAATGDVLAEQTMPELPQWDGMVVADGRLFVVMEDGTVMCLGD